MRIYIKIIYKYIIQWTFLSLILILILGDVEGIEFLFLPIMLLNYILIAMKFNKLVHASKICILGEYYGKSNFDILGVYFIANLPIVVLFNNMLELSSLFLVVLLLVLSNYLLFLLDTILNEVISIAIFIACLYFMTILIF